MRTRRHLARGVQQRGARAVGVAATVERKLLGAVIAEPAVVHVELSSSAMNASLRLLPTKPGYSSERNLKSKVRQFAPLGTVTSVLTT